MFNTKSIISNPRFPESLGCVDWRERLPEGDPSRPSKVEINTRRQNASHEFDVLGSALIRFAREIPIDKKEASIL